jgi:hypothetical protein
MTPTEIVQTLPRQVQALHNDTALYLDPVMSTPQRKDLILSSILLIKDRLNDLEKSLS